MESHHQAAASEIHKELTFNRPKTVFEVHSKSNSLELKPDVAAEDYEIDQFMGGVHTKAIESDNPISIEAAGISTTVQDVKIARDIKRKHALLKWKWDAVIDLEEDASDDGWDADEDYGSDDVSTDGSYDQSETEPTATPPKKIPRVTVHKRHRLSRVRKEWDAIGFDV